MSEPTISALVVIHNEDEVLDACLERLGWVDELVVVLDKCTDQSKEIALKYGARLLEGSWEFEGDRRNTGIEFCNTDWVLEVDADEWITEELATEIRETIAATSFDVHNLAVHNYIGDKYIKHGWGGGAFGKQGYIGLFRKGVKHWGPQRIHPHLTVSGTEGPTLKSPVVHHIDRNISDMLQRLDRYTTWRAKDLVDNDEVGKLPNMIRKFFSRFWKVYVVRGAYKENGYGFMNALCTALYPPIAHIKAVQEELPAKQKSVMD